ncbi:apo-citrate lyase phosphoribosyl-dephospho-coa transferase [Lucifera butyrica]|uniref:Probable 2-(5''-triphosphoribosyl)-3'-dephosphocoenzyme-A synthase n=1 Tax=Lucifera butyrica TaxID=1351585 RepID=A0A498R8W2_9FIRM|nr:citrate lyase holo-[acyl-carrier protein] synthase [Lucifera butyrica]VBB07387.1 apo-citrate lyase phosphoribosyl-dephospho-coa transferase [Lucifera butyrica]
MTEVILEDILTAKENRRLRQIALIDRYGLPVVSITLTIPGSVKDSPVLRCLRDYGVEKIKGCCDVVATEEINSFTGPEALLAVRQEAGSLKRLVSRVEEEQSFGRLLDMDVLDERGASVACAERGIGRSCLLCGRPAVVCMREQTHPAEELRSAVENLLNRFKAHQAHRTGLLAEKLGELALEAMLFEVACTPSPGLVDRNNSGAHMDMDFFTFLSSSASLAQTMACCAQAGLNHNGPLPDLLPVLRLIGREGEQRMLEATGGVNTQKGLLFALGVVVAVSGWLLRESGQPDVPSVFEAVAASTEGIVARELATAANKRENQRTAGERLYLTWGVTGIRGEMEAGIPAVRERALPVLKHALAGGLNPNDALVHTLLELMTCVEDTTVMNRHDPDKLRQWARQKAARFLADGGMEQPSARQKAEELDKEFIAHNVSCGGAADLLAVTWFLYRFAGLGQKNGTDA